MYTDGTGDHNHDDYNTGRADKSVWNLHTGTYYSTGVKFLSIAGDKIQTYGNEVRFDPNKIHRIEVAWDGGVVELFIDGTLIAGNHHGADFSLRRIFIGRDRTHSVDIATGYPDNEYPAMIGPIYSNLAVFADAQVATQLDPDGPETDPGSEPSSTGSGEMRIDINCDDVFDLWVNGSYLGGNGQWDVAQRFSASMRDGENVVAVKGRNTGGATGLVVEVSVDGQVVLQTGTDWHWNSTEQPNWQAVGFDDAGWSATIDLGSYGVSPWGTGINNFPPQSQAHWIWGNGREVYFRGSFDAAQDITPPPDPQPSDPPVPPSDFSPALAVWRFLSTLMISTISGSMDPCWATMTSGMWPSATWCRWQATT